MMYVTSSTSAHIDEYFDISYIKLNNILKTFMKNLRKAKFLSLYRLRSYETITPGVTPSNIFQTCDLSNSKHKRTLQPRGTQAKSKF